MTLPPFWLFLYASFYDGIGHFERRQTCNCKKKNHLFSNLFFLSQSLLFFFLLGLPQRETKLKIALRFFFFFFFFVFIIQSQIAVWALKTHAQVILSLHGFAWVGHFLVGDFRVFRRKTQLFQMVHRKKNYLGILNSFDSGNPRNNGEETVLRVQIVVLSRRRVSGARTSQILIQATDFLQNFLVLLGIQRLKNCRFDREFVLKYYSN